MARKLKQTKRAKAERARRRLQLEQSQPNEPKINLGSGDSDSADSSAATTSNPAFEAAAAQLEGAAVATEGAAPEVVAEKSFGEQLIEKFVQGLCSDEQIRKYLPVPFNAIAVAAKQECCRLQDWEVEIWAPAVQACGVRYGPELLKATDKPELVMLATAAAIYAARVVIQWERENKKPEPEVLPPDPRRESPDGSATAASAGSLDI